MGHHAGDCESLAALERLFPRKDRVLHRFSDAELERRFRRDLNGFAGRRVAAFAGLALRANEFAEAREDKFSVGLNFVRRQVGQIFEKLLYLSALHAGPLCEIINHVRLRHPFPASSRCRHLLFPASKTSANLKNCPPDIPQTDGKVCKKAQNSGVKRKKSLKSSGMTARRLGGLDSH